MTKRESELYRLSKEFIEQNDYSPTYDWLMKQMGLKSKSGINRIVCSLEVKGRLIRVGTQKKIGIPVVARCPHCGGKVYT